MRTSRTNLRLLLACAPVIIVGALGSFFLETGCGQTFAAGNGGEDAASPGDAGPEVVTLAHLDGAADAAADAASGCPAGELACDAGCIEAGLLNCGACGHD